MVNPSIALTLGLMAVASLLPSRAAAQTTETTETTETAVAKTYTLTDRQGTMDHPYRRLLSLVAVLIAVLTTTATPCAAEWRRLDSPNFVIVGDVGARALRDIAVKFEGFRETLSRVLTDRVTSTAVPTIVIVFSSDKAFTPFKPKYQGKTVDLAGLFLSRKDVNYIALASTGGEEAMRVVFHEYAHLIISNVGRNIPVWLNEGLAEYYSTYQVGGGGREAVLGTAIASHLIQLNQATPLPLQQLLAVAHDSPMYNEGSRRSVFYAQSWALTHMLLLGEPRRTPQLGQFLSMVGQGAPAADAWARVFGADAIERDLNSYIRRRVFSAYRYTFADKLATFEGVAAPLGAADAEAFLADFLVQQGRQEEAAERLGKGAGDASPWRSTVGALIELANSEYDVAQKRLLGLDQGVEWLTGYRAGIALAETVERQGEKPSAPVVAAARKLFEAAQRDGRDIPNAVARLAALELAGDEPPAASTASALERARVLAPGRVDYAFLHARVLVEQSAYLPARNVVAPLMSPVYPVDVRDSARSLMGYIVRLEAAKAMAAAPPAAGSADAAPPAELPRTPSSPRSTGATDDPGGRAPTDPGEAAGRRTPAAFPFAQPIFRDLGAGERRLEGLLDRIECARTEAVFHVRTTEGPVRLTAARMDAVEFITYRDDLKGRVGCGPLPEPARVYVAWRQRADSAARVAVAVEFLPR